MRGKNKGLGQSVQGLRRLIEEGYVLDSRGRLVHRRVCWQAWGPFPRDWVVHHVDMNRKNNEPVNLIALPRELHNSIHKSMRRGGTTWSRIQVEQALNSYRKLRSKGQVVINITIVDDKSTT